MAGEYITWFREEGSKERSLLYKLESTNIVKCESERRADGWIVHQWVLTKAGQKLIDENECLQEIWGDGKHLKVLEFYNEIQKLKTIELQGGKN